MAAGPAERAHPRVDVGALRAGSVDDQPTDGVGRASATTTSGAASRSSSWARTRSFRRRSSTSRRQGVSYHDITPRVGAVYDVFGNGRTALKVNIGKYLVAADGSSITGGLLNPLSRVSTTANRTWTDANAQLPARLRSAESAGAGSAGRGRRLLRPEQQSELRPAGVQHHLRPGHPRPGWGKRGLRLELRRPGPAGAAAARLGGRRLLPPHLRQLLRHRQPGDTARPTTTRSASPRRPIRGCPAAAATPLATLYNVTPALSGVTDNFQTFSDEFGGSGGTGTASRSTSTPRVRGGLTFQGGTSTGTARSTTPASSARCCRRRRCSIPTACRSRRS